MYYCKQMVSNIKLLKILNDESITISIDNVLSANSNTYKLGPEPINNFELFRGRIYITDWNSNFIILDQSLEIIEIGHKKEYFYSSSYYLGHQFINSEGLIVEALITQDNQVINIGQINKTVNKNLSSITQYFLIIENKIESFSLPNPCILWDFNLHYLHDKNSIDNKNKTFEVRQFVGLYLDRLYVNLNTREIIVLDISNGALIQRLSFIDELIGESSIGWSENEIPFFETDYILDDQREIILGLAIDLYYEIDVKSEKAHARAYSLKSEFEKHNINPQNISKNNVYHEGHLYFLDKEKSRFAVLNTTTKEIVFISDPITIQNKPDAWPQLKEIQVNKDKVYVLASDHTLHIFERTL